MNHSISFNDFASKDGKIVASFVSVKLKRLFNACGWALNESTVVSAYSSGVELSDSEQDAVADVDETDPYSRSATGFRAPPRGFWATLRQVGPGLILVGSIVGSGELILTTKLGAVAGFTLLWFVLISCVIKVVIQAELARHTISSGETFLHVFNRLPGPSGQRPVWMTLPWMATVLVSCALGLIAFMQVGGSPHSGFMRFGVVVVALSVPIIVACVISRWKRSVGLQTIDEPEARPRMNWYLWMWLSLILVSFVNAGAILGGAGQAIELAVPNSFDGGDSRGWAILTGIVAATILLTGRYQSLEKTFVVLVATFTLLTFVCTALLQWTDNPITWSEIQSGLEFAIPEPMNRTLILTALAMYVATGVAFGEIYTYTYWCVEKGYARNVGSVQPGDDWPQRARGWIKVMYTDVYLTMIVYTSGTVCFYFLGAKILHARGLNPDGTKTLETLSYMYRDSLDSEWASTLFVVGGFFVLFTTVIANVAGGSRLMADALGVMGLIDSKDYTVRLWYIRFFTVLYVAMYSLAYWLFENPPAMLLVTNSILGAAMYPVLGLGTIYLRYREVDKRILPGKLTTTWLWICGIALAVISPGGVLLLIALK